MVLDARIQLVRDYFNVQSLDDWGKVDPRDVLTIDGVGPVTLDHIRLYLAGQQRTLKNDRTPEFWVQHLGQAKIVQQIADEDRAVICPFTILVDSAEQQPFGFQGIRCDADQQHRPMIVKTEWRSLGRHPYGLGDYSIDGYIGQVHVERKSVPDLQSTVLGFKSDRRERFETELANLAKCTSLVVVEGTLLAALQLREPNNSLTKVLMRSVLAYQQDYAVPWLFCDSRRLAEICTFRFLERFWRKKHEAKKESEKLLASI